VPLIFQSRNLGSIMVIAVPKRLPNPIDRNARGNSIRNGAAVAVCAVGAGLFLSTSFAQRKSSTLGKSRSLKYVRLNLFFLMSTEWCMDARALC